jgi:hypothetical protein
MIHGTDVSSHQPNWRPSVGDDFVFVKTTEGRSFVSPVLDRQLDRGRDAGLVIGFYHFLWPQFDRSRADGTVTSNRAVSGTPEVQARWFVDHTPSRPGDLLVCDWEYAGSKQRGEEGGHPTFREKDRFLAEVRRLRPQNRVGLYVNASTWKASNKRRGDFLWIAEYDRPQPTIDEQWAFWQFADHTPNGTPLDQNKARFDTRQALRAWATSPTHSQEEDMPLANDDLARIADAVLTRDGKIPNEFTGNPDNQFVSVSTALAFIGKQLDDISAALTRLTVAVEAKD